MKFQFVTFPPNKPNDNPALEELKKRLSVLEANAATVTKESSTGPSTQATDSSSEPQPKRKRQTIWPYGYQNGNYLCICGRECGNKGSAIRHLTEKKCSQ